MDNVSLFVKSIIAITFLWSIAECVLLDNFMQKYSSFMYGIIVVSLTVALFSKMHFNDFFIACKNTNSTEFDSDYINELYEKRLEDILTDKFGDETIDVELTDDYKIKDISCENKKTYDDIMRYLYE